MSAPDYPILVYYSEEDKCWIADIPDLQYCTAHGKTPENAVRELQLAKLAWLEAALANNRPIPKPTHKPELPLIASAR